MRNGLGRARCGRAAARALLALVTTSACAGTHSEPVEARVVGLDELVRELGPREAPDGSLEPLLVNFWAIWCPPCLAELPDLVQVAAEHAGSLRVVAVSQDLAQPFAEGIDGPEDVAAFAAAHGIELEILVYEGRIDALNERLDLPGPIPFTFARDRHGKVADRQVGMASRERFEELAAAALR